MVINKEEWDTFTNDEKYMVYLSGEDAIYDYKHLASRLMHQNEKLRLNRC